eukprot:10350160-Ditylum_brightwellii.AAC.1
MSRSSTTKGEDMGVATNNRGVTSNDNNIAENSANTSVAAIANASVSNPEFIKDTMFQVTHRGYCGWCVEVEASPETLMEIFFQIRLCTELFKQATCILVIEEKNPEDCCSPKQMKLLVKAD